MQTYYWQRQWKADFASFQTFSGLFQLVESVKIQENKPELKTGNGVRAQRDRIKLNAFVFTSSTELKIWSFQVVDVQDGRELQSGCFAYWNYHVFDPLLVWRGCASKLSVGWSARAVKPRGDGGRSNKKPFLFFLQFGGSFARAFLASPLTRARPRYFSFRSPPPPPSLPCSKKKTGPLLRRLQLCRRLRQLDELDTKHGRACGTIPGAKCGICVSLVKFLIGRESGINFFANLNVWLGKTVNFSSYQSPNHD